VSARADCLMQSHQFVSYIMTRTCKRDVQKIFVTVIVLLHTILFKTTIFHKCIPKPTIVRFWSLFLSTKPESYSINIIRFIL